MDWLRDISETFDTLSLNMEAVNCEETIRYVGNQLRAVGNHAAGLWSDFMNNFQLPEYETPVVSDNQEPASHVDNVEASPMLNGNLEESDEVLRVDSSLETHSAVSDEVLRVDSSVEVARFNSSGEGGTSKTLDASSLVPDVSSESESSDSGASSDDKEELSNVNSLPKGNFEEPDKDLHSDSSLGKSVVVGDGESCWDKVNTSSMLSFKNSGFNSSGEGETSKNLDIRSLVSDGSSKSDFSDSGVSSDDKEELGNVNTLPKENFEEPKKDLHSDPSLGEGAVVGNEESCWEKGNTSVMLSFKDLGSNSSGKGETNKNLDTRSLVSEASSESKLSDSGVSSDGKEELSNVNSLTKENFEEPKKDLLLSDSSLGEGGVVRNEESCWGNANTSVMVSFKDLGFYSSGEGETSNTLDAKSLVLDEPREFMFIDGVSGYYNLSAFSTGKSDDASTKEVMDLYEDASPEELIVNPVDNDITESVIDPRVTEEETEMDQSEQYKLDVETTSLSSVDTSESSVLDLEDIINADQSIEKEEFEQQNTSEDLEEVISETGGEYSSIPSLTSFESVLSDDEFSESDWVVV